MGLEQLRYEIRSARLLSREEDEAQLVQREVLSLRLASPYHVSEVYGEGEEGVLGLSLPWVRIPYALGAVKTGT